ncbi:MAG: hypothetical protein JXA11_09620 [Phycisphaerae bacterium]|nr:hypothetical protein [Phycisphaerae bacterium]
MRNNENKFTPTDAGDRALEEEVFQTLHALGWLAPECEKDVQRAEAEFTDATMDLPEILRDSATVFEDKKNETVDVIPFTLGSDAQVDEHLAQAARNGKPIPPEIEKRMRRDRQEAERKRNQTEDGENIE